MKEIKKQIVLLAEDDKFISLAYKDGLARAGYEVIHAENGKKALDLAKKNKPNIILLDVIMPEMNGFEVLTALKKEKLLKKIPVVILSNLGQESDILKGQELGATDYMIKSNYSLGEVVDKIKKILD
ncbi:MAG: response regulator [Patescibacteria group bacterium]|jgi:two-component system alkaline phosphatase synthesis response regulator PhoP|nr:response regulator [Patescibacteria group bacterium]